MGIFYRLFGLLEDRAHHLDFQAVSSGSTVTQHLSAAVESYSKNQQQLSDLKEERMKVEEKVTLMEQVATLAAVNTSGSFTTTPTLLQAMLDEAAVLRQELDKLVNATCSFTMPYTVCL